MTKISFPLLISLASTGVAAAQQSISYQDSFTFLPNASQALGFSKFNPALGILIGVTVSFELTKSGGFLLIDNDSPSPASGNISQTVDVTLNSAGGLLSADGLTPNPRLSITSSYFANLAADDGDGGGPDAHTAYQPGGPDSDEVLFASETLANSSNLSPLVFSQFIGTGNVTLTANGDQTSDTATLGGSFFVGGPASASGVVRVTYLYSPISIPEPAAPLIGAMGAILLLRRRR